MKDHKRNLRGRGESSHRKQQAKYTHMTPNQSQG
jgi:hypothetical protein